MNLLYKQITVFLVSLGLVAGLSIVPKLDNTLQLAVSNEAATRIDNAVVLTDRNLVDVVGRYSFHLDISRVEWSDSILRVDLYANSNETSTGSIYDDLFELVRLGFSGTSNVNQLLVRVMERQSPAGGSAQLILAMEANRSDLDGGKWNGNLQKNKNKEQFLASHFNLTYTHRWLDQHRRSS